MDGNRSIQTAGCSVAAPSASVIVLSPRNEILLLHRIEHGAFAAAHVFPGGNLSSFHEGALVPTIDSPARHVDGPAYRLAAIRETYEESGVLLARPVEGGAEPLLLCVPDDVASAGRKRVEGKEERFTDWLASVGGVPDSDGLVPFTRWITPPNLKRRFTTQMYLYLLPLDGDTTATADLTEVATAEFAPAAVWVQRAQRNEIILFPPQLYLLAVLAPVLRGPGGLPAGTEGLAAVAHYAAEREQLQQLMRRPATDQTTPWADMVISPTLLGRLADGRVVMGLDQPGPELRGSGRHGDDQRVVVVGNMPPGPPRDVELRPRAEVMAAVRAAKAVRGRTGPGETKL